MSTDWTGQVLEAVTGQPLDEIVREQRLAQRDAAVDANVTARLTPE